MIELDAKPFVGAVTQLRTLQMAIGRVQDRSALISDADQDVLDRNLPVLIDALEGVGAKLALKTSGRLSQAFLNGSRLSYETVMLTLADIEARFVDHVEDVRLFVIHDHESK